MVTLINCVVDLRPVFIVYSIGLPISGLKQISPKPSWKKMESSGVEVIMSRCQVRRLCLTKYMIDSSLKMNFMV